MSNKKRLSYNNQQFQTSLQMQKAIYPGVLTLLIGKERVPTTTSHLGSLYHGSLDVTNDNNNNDNDDNNNFNNDRETSTTATLTEIIYKLQQ